ALASGPYNHPADVGKFPPCGLPCASAIVGILQRSAAMSDAIPNTPFPAEAPPPGNVPDPLAGDWSEGLRGAVRALGIPEPKLLDVESIIPPPPPRAALPAAPAPAEAVEAPDAWAAA